MHESVSVLFGFDQKRASWVSHGGPVVEQNSTIEEFDSFINKAIRLARKQKVRSIDFLALPPLRNWPDKFEEIFIHNGLVQKKWLTPIVDLNETEDRLFRNLEHSARKQINKARKVGIKVKLCKTFDEFYELFLSPYLIISGRQDQGKDFYKKLWALDSEGVYHYWVAVDKDDNISGFLGTYRFNGLSTEIMSAMTPYARENRLPVQDLLHWEIMLFHKKLGDSYFDLAGINPDPKDTKEIGIRRFKEKWGGKLYDTSSYQIEFISPLRSLLRKIKRTIRG